MLSMLTHINAEEEEEKALLKPNTKGRGLRDAGVMERRRRRQPDWGAAAI